ncbi:Hsp20/alpha crystallin family protein [candidate division WOR-3 bacterium]|nr:Hsp20/alpha crystallin family protein [candidate division WOR-3 bacterium]
MIYDFFPAGTYEEMRRLKESINSAFNSFSAGYPFCNIYESPEKTCISFFAPGLREDDIDISATPDSLTISIDRKKVFEEQAMKEERPFGTFRRTVNFPFKVNTEKHWAKYKNGVLRLIFERAEEDKPKKIKIN